MKNDIEYIAGDGPTMCTLRSRQHCYLEFASMRNDVLSEPFSMQKPSGKIMQNPSFRMLDDTTRYVFATSKVTHAVLMRHGRKDGGEFVFRIQWIVLVTILFEYKKINIELKILVGNWKKGFMKYYYYL